MVFRVRFRAPWEDQSKVIPTILIVTTTRWVSLARLAVSLANSGCIVDAVCPSRQPITLVTALRKAYPYLALSPIASIKDAIASAKPSLIIPGDDLATTHLHRLYFREKSRGKHGEFVCSLIERSLGSPESFPIVYARTQVMKLAQEMGVRVPKTEVIAKEDDLAKWADNIGFPAVLKADGSYGGEGVRIVQTLEEAKRAFRVVKAPPHAIRAMKRAIVDQDMTLVLPTLLRRKSVVNAQSFVAGREATSLAACWKGTVLAVLHFEVINKQDALGPATVLRLIANAEMSTAAEKMARRLNLSGLHGFDFMLESQTGNAYLIEINPRATQIGHLRFGPGRDLTAALRAAVCGEPVQEAPKVTENDTIALFPHEWKRNPASAFLRTGYHDVPWEEPELIRALVRKTKNWSAWQIQRKNWLAMFSADRLPRL